MHETEARLFDRCDDVSVFGNVLIAFADQSLAKRYLEHRQDAFSESGPRVVVDDTHIATGLCVLWRLPIHDREEFEFRLNQCRWLVQEIVSGRQALPASGDVVIVTPSKLPAAPLVRFCIQGDFPISAWKIAFRSPEETNGYESLFELDDESMDAVLRILADTGLEIGDLPLARRASIVHELLMSWCDHSRLMGEAIDERIENLLRSKTQSISRLGLANVIAQYIARRSKVPTDTQYLRPLPAGMNAKETLVAFFERYRERNMQGSERLVEIARARFGLDGTVPVSVDALAQRYSVSKVRIRQLEHKAIRIVIGIWGRLGSLALDEVKSIAESTEPLTELGRGRLQELCGDASSIPMILRLVRRAAKAYTPQRPGMQSIAKQRHNDLID